MSDAKTIIAVYLKKHRKSEELTIKDLSKKMGVSVNTVHRWETDKNSPNKTSLKKIADFLHITVESLLSGDIINNYSEHKFSCPYDMSILEQQIFVLSKEMPVKYQHKILRYIKRLHKDFLNNKESFEKV